MKLLVSLFILKLYARINIFKLLLIFPFRKTKWKQRRRKNKTITILKNYMRRAIKILSEVMKISSFLFFIRPVDSFVTLAKKLFVVNFDFNLNNVQFTQLQLV